MGCAALTYARRAGPTELKPCTRGRAGRAPVRTCVVSGARGVSGNYPGTGESMARIKIFAAFTARGAVRYCKRNAWAMSSTN
eukprot:7037709-Prymnesium_polylepis.1